MPRAFLLLASLLVAFGCSGAFAAQSAAPTPSPPLGQTSSSAYSFTEAMIPMRDGVRLQTVILAPLGAHEALPILMRRTPYGVPDKAFEAVPADLKALAADGYITV